MRAAAARHRLDNLGYEDLTALRHSAQPSGFNHRIAEVVVLFPAGLAPAYAHTQSKRNLIGSIVAIDGLLHPNGARQRTRGRGKCHHEAVAEVLDLSAARCRYGLAQDRVVALAPLVRDVA